ncbi:MAG: 30S ribosomal protein S3 [Patescibacteria group bacterium]|jgi:small subunit ribosomal protein S3|nr:30S ribosomal protein S3 [Patescibacteria group bacterium]
MGHKVNPISMRLQLNKDWSSKWFADKRNYTTYLKQDIMVRNYISKNLGSRSSINKVEISRTPNLVTVTIFTGKAGVIIGKGGNGVSELQKNIEKIFNCPTRINIEEIKKTDLYAKLVGENIAHQIEKRINFRKALKNGISNVMNAGVKGVKIQISGRLNGVDMARTEKEVAGTVPLHTIRANVDYAQVNALTKDGIISTKVWIYKGDN